MKKSKLLLALAVSAMLINSAYASEMRNDQKVNEIEAEDPITNPKVAEYKVKKIYEEGLILWTLITKVMSTMFQNLILRAWTLKKVRFSPFIQIGKF